MITSSNIMNHYHPCYRLPICSPARPLVSPRMDTEVTGFSKELTLPWESEEERWHKSFCSAWSAQTNCCSHSHSMKNQVNPRKVVVTDSFVELIPYLASFCFVQLHYRDETCQLFAVPSSLTSRVSNMTISRQWNVSGRLLEGKLAFLVTGTRILGTIVSIFVALTLDRTSGRGADI